MPTGIGHDVVKKSGRTMDDSSLQQVDRHVLLALLDASKAINQVLEVDRLLDLVVEHALKVFEVEGASVLVLDDNQQELIFQAVSGDAAQQLIGKRMEADRGIAGQTIKTGRPVCVNDVTQNVNFDRSIDSEAHFRTKSLIAAPMIYQDQPVGVVEVINPKGRNDFTQQEVDLLQVFANLVAGPTRHARTLGLLQRQNQILKESGSQTQLIGRSDVFEQVISVCRKVAPSNTTVLLTGETGTGKEMVARFIHDVSKRCDGPLVPVHCAALPEQLFESELFGHVKGAFTGATREKPGRFELADGGTLFLDEVGEIPMTMQVKLLRVLEQREFSRVGSAEVVPCDARLVAATNRDLKQEVEDKSFREDLYYRLNVMPIHLPPLRDRPEDIPVLIDHLLKAACADMGREAPAVSDDAMQRLSGYAWPGNVRELRNVLERAALLCNGNITPEHLTPEVVGGDASQASGLGSASQSSSDDDDGSSVLAQQEKALVLKALEDSNWNQSAAARSLGLSRDNLRYRMKKYGLSKPG